MRQYVYEAQLTAEPECLRRLGLETIATRRSKAPATCLPMRLLTYPERDMDLPEPTARKRGLCRWPLPAQVAAKLAVWQAWRASGISKSELARRLGLGEGEARRILDPDHLTSLPRLEAALQALGKQLIVGVSAA